MFQVLIVQTLLILAQDIACDNAFRCYSCKGDYSFESCSIQTCSPRNNENIHRCHFEETVTSGNVRRLYAGCATSYTCPLLNVISNQPIGTVKTCRFCCDTETCNRPLCSATGSVIHFTTQDPSITTIHHTMCLSCNGSSSMEACTETTICPAGQHCSMEVFSNRESEMEYYGGCSSINTCTSNSFPARSGQSICSSCCDQDYCNSDVCTDKVKAFKASISVGSKRQCLQCYDQPFDQLEGCYKKVDCSSQCAQVLRNESGILAVDMDCEENLPCTTTVDKDHDVCDICCNWDLCNREVDCRYPVSMTTSSPTTATPTTTTSSIVTTLSSPKKCYKCSDIRVDSKGKSQLCYSVVSCANPSSKCSTMYQEENGIVTVNMDCEENLPCNQHFSSPETCSSCCDTDLCNQDLDCRPQKSTTTQPTTLRTNSGVECEVCSGPECGVDSTRAPSVQCNNTTPYCLSTVLNDVNGDKHVTKRCGSVSECSSKWLQKSSLLADCVNFDPSNIYSHAFECTYCCVTHNCNRNIRPQNVTLYNPGVYLP